VPDGSFGWPSRDRNGLVRSAIGTWRDGLINLTGSNRLLNFKPSRTSAISVVRPAPREVLSRVAGAYRFRSLPPRSADTGQDVNEPDLHNDVPVPPPATDRLDADKPADDLAAALPRLYRRSNQDCLDRGVWVLYPAFDTSVWTDEDRAATRDRGRVCDSVRRFVMVHLCPNIGNTIDRFLTVNSIRNGVRG
jgi:hypothetical protein